MCNSTILLYILLSSNYFVFPSFFCPWVFTSTISMLNLDMVVIQNDVCHHSKVIISHINWHCFTDSSQSGLSYFWQEWKIPIMPSYKNETSTFYNKKASPLSFPVDLNVFHWGNVTIIEPSFTWTRRIPRNFLFTCSDLFKCIAKY